MSRKVLVCGCGNLGRWHIVGLGKSEHDITVYAMDASDNALKSIDELIGSYLSGFSNLKIHKYPLNGSILCDLPDMDLVIVATTAFGRDEVVRQLCSMINSDYWLIEKPIAQSTERIRAIEQSLRGERAYVNHPRRIMPWHQEIKSVIAEVGEVVVDVKYPRLAIAGNISHYLDLLNWWTGEKPVSVTIDGPENSWYPAKRNNFFEFGGELEVVFDGGSVLRIQSGETLGDKNLRVFSQGCFSGWIDETLGVAEFDHGQTIKGSILPQSTLTGVVLDNLVSLGASDLPSLSLSAEINILTTDALLENWNASFSGHDLTLPIT